MLSALNGKKTYIAALVTAAIGLAGAFGVAVPDWAIQLLTAFGLYAVRDAISKAS